MRKIVLTGGDNCYCVQCGQICDRLVMEIDEENKVLRYIDDGEFCLGKWCWRDHVCEDGTILCNRWGEHYALRNGVKMPFVAKKNKWGKDGEFGIYGFIHGSKTDKGYELVRFKKGLEEVYWQDYENSLKDKTPMKPDDYYYEPTGWVLSYETIERKYN